MIHLLFGGCCMIVLAYIACIRVHNRRLEECTKEEEDSWNT